MRDLVLIRHNGCAVSRGRAWPEFYQQMLNQLDEGVCFVSRNRRILLWNSAAERITGFTAGEMVGRSCFDELLKHTNDDGSCLCDGSCPLLAAIDDGHQRDCRIFLRHKHGHHLPVHVRACPIMTSEGNIVGAVETFRDRTEELASIALVKSLERLVFLDSLTGIGNRSYIEIKLRDAVAKTHSLGWPAALLFTDIDHFKRINDT
jgi:PAS domain S-box-containing protein